MIQDSINIAVKHILDEHSFARACGSCPIGCSDLVRFICLGFTSDDITKWCDKHQDILKNEMNKMY